MEPHPAVAYQIRSGRRGFIRFLSARLRYVTNRNFYFVITYRRYYHGKNDNNKVNKSGGKSEQPRQKLSQRSP